VTGKKRKNFEEASRLLQAAGYVVTPPKKSDPPPDNTCATCGKNDTQNERDGYGPLTDVVIVLAASEEGHSELKKFLCQEHLVAFTNHMQDLDLVVHVHGGICYLEDVSCPGYLSPAQCPTPERQYAE